MAQATNGSNNGSQGKPYFNQWVCRSAIDALDQGAIVGAQSIAQTVYGRFGG
jgi:hypothetical protein